MLLVHWTRLQLRRGNLARAREALARAQDQLQLTGESLASETGQAIALATEELQRFARGRG
jgi:hypothetical protein